MVHRRRFLKIYSLKFCDIWQNFYFYRILNNETFKMAVEQMIFESRLRITVQYNTIIQYNKKFIVKIHGVLSQGSVKARQLIYRYSTNNKIKS